jgi:hypothetical protein
VKAVSTKFLIFGGDESDFGAPSGNSKAAFSTIDAASTVD